MADSVPARGAFAPSRRVRRVARRARPVRRATPIHWPSPRSPNFDPDETDIDDKIGTPGYVGITTRGSSRPIRSSTTRASAGCSAWCIRRRRCRRRWRSSGTITSRPRTARSRASSARPTATRMMAAKPSDDPAGARGQIELFRAVRARQLPRSARGRREGSGDARLARRPARTRRPSRRRTSAAS